MVTPAQNSEINKQYVMQNQSLGKQEEEKSKQIVLKPDSSQISTDHWYAIILKGYENFSSKKDITSLNQCIGALEKLKQTYKELYTVDPEEASKLKPTIDEATKFVQEMNMVSPTLTVQDLSNIASFFKPPVEKFYIDEETKIKYLQPDLSGASKFASEFFLTGEYGGFGLLKEKKVSGTIKEVQTDGSVLERKIQNELCDIVYLIKQDDQIDYEKRGDSSSKSGWRRFLQKDSSKDQPVKERIESQQELIKQAIPEIDKKIAQDWHYARAFIADTGALLSLKYSLETAIKNHVLFLFYKKANQN